MGIKKTIEEPEDLEYQLAELEKKLDRLRVLYEQHFLGIEKRPPFTLQHDVVRMIRDIGSYQIRKTALKFRYLSLTQRFNVHRAYWLRTLREIEEGTYRRDRLRAERREVARSGEALDAAELAKRSLLLEHKGEDAVEARRERTATPDEPIREAYVPAIARKKKRKKISADEIRGVSADLLADRRDELEEAHARVEAALHPPGRHNGGPPVALPRSPLFSDLPRPEDSGLGEGPASTPVPGSPFRPQPSLAGAAPPPGATPPLGASPFEAPPPPAPFGSPAAPRPVTPTGTPAASRPALGPPPGRPGGPADSPFATPVPRPSGTAPEPARPAASTPPPSASPFGAGHAPAATGVRTPPVGKPEGTSSPFSAPRPTAARPAPESAPRPTPQTADTARQAARVLEHAGLPEERARQIYRDLVAARARFGKTAGSLTYEHVLESMARQVPKLRETHGAQRIDFDVVTKDDKVFLKPKPR